MKSLIAVAALLVCMAVYSHQVDVIEKDGTQYVKVNDTHYGVTGPELFKQGIKCARVSGQTITFWKQEGCESVTKQMSELSETELESIKLKQGEAIYSVPDSSSSVVLKFKDSLVFFKVDDQFQMKPIECLDDEEKKLIS